MDKLPKLNFDFRLNSTEKVLFFASSLNLIFRNNSENACLVIHFLTNQMQIKFNSKKKIEIRFGKFLVNSGSQLCKQRVILRSRVLRVYSKSATLLIYSILQLFPNYRLSLLFKPFRAPEPLPILNPSNCPQKRVSSCKGVNPHLNSLKILCCFNYPTFLIPPPSSLITPYFPSSPHCSLPRLDTSRFSLLCHCLQDSLFISSIGPHIHHKCITLPSSFSSNSPCL